MRVPRHLLARQVFKPSTDNGGPAFLNIAPPRYDRLARVPSIPAKWDSASRAEPRLRLRFRRISMISRIRASREGDWNLFCVWFLKAYVHGQGFCSIVQGGNGCGEEIVLGDEEVCSV